jgi:hypothetical protein
LQSTVLANWELFFPQQFVKDTMIPEMNKLVRLGSIHYGEFLRWIGLWFLMATIQGPARHEFWKLDPINIFAGAPFRLNEYMSRNRFEDILGALTYTSSNPPNYIDKFFRIRGLLQAWNDNMKAVFIPGWITCLDESMSVWTSMWTCPGHMFVPRKPHPMGNEYHSICCGLTGIMFAIELVEGKDRPAQHGLPQYDSLGGKTVGLLLRLSENLWHSGKIVVLDSGFCVLRGLIELRKKGVFAAAIVKKRRYWPKFIAGDDIKRHFDEGKFGVGDADAISGILDNTAFHLFAMKEPDYVMTLMSTYGTLDRKGKETERDILENGTRQKIPVS